MSDTPSFIELQQMHAEAKRLAQEAAADKKAAAEDRAKAEYDRGQAEWRNRDTDAKLAIIAAREKWLSENGEAVMREREQAAADKLAQAQALMSDYRADKHGAARALISINAREAAREAAARETPAAA